MTAWPIGTLGDVATLNRLSLSRDWSYKHLKYLDISSVGEGVVTSAPLSLILGNAPSRARRLLAKGDTILSTVRPNRRAMFFAKDPDPDIVVSTGFCVITPHASRIDPRFLFYCVFSHEFTDYLVSREKGAAYPAVTSDDISLAPIPFPPIEEQRAIAATLGALDDKIESHRRLVDLIPRLIRTMVFDALGAHPGVVAVSDIATFVNGGAYTKGASGTGRIVIRIAELNSGPGGSTVYNDIDVPEEKAARAGDILMSWSGSLGLYRWFRDEAIVNQHIFKVLPSDGYPPWLVFDRLDTVMPVFQAIAKDKATTMGHIQRGHLETTTVEIPTPETIDLLGGLIAPLWQRLLLAEREVVELTALRDALLPELLSGRIRVPEADGAVA